MSVPNNKLVSYMYMYLEKHGKIEITLWHKIFTQNDQHYYIQYINRDKVSSFKLFRINA